MKYIEDAVVFKRTRSFKITRKDNEKEYYRADITAEIKIVKERLDWNFNKGSFYVLSFIGELYHSYGRGRPESTGFGQISDELEELMSSGKWNIPMELKIILTLWNRYHLNYLTPGTKKQMEALKASGMLNKSYDEQIKFLKNKGLYIDNGYEYGTKWLVEPIPIKYINMVKNLFDNSIQQCHEEINL